MSDDQDGGEWVCLLVSAHPGSPGPKVVKRLCVCVWGGRVRRDLASK